MNTCKIFSICSIFLTIFLINNILSLQINWLPGKIYKKCESNPCYNNWNITLTNHDNATNLPNYKPYYHLLAETRSNLDDIDKILDYSIKKIKLLRELADTERKPEVVKSETQAKRIDDLTHRVDRLLTHPYQVAQRHLALIKQLVMPVEFNLDEFGKKLQNARKDLKNTEKSVVYCRATSKQLNDTITDLTNKADDEQTRFAALTDKIGKLNESFNDNQGVGPVDFKYRCVEGCVHESSFKCLGDRREFINMENTLFPVLTSKIQEVNELKQKIDKLDLNKFRFESELNNENILEAMKDFDLMKAAMEFLDKSNNWIFTVNDEFGKMKQMHLKPESEEIRKLADDLLILIGELRTVVTAVDFETNLQRSQKLFQDAKLQKSHLDSITEKVPKILQIMSNRNNSSITTKETYFEVVLDEVAKIEIPLQTKITELTKRIDNTKLSELVKITNSNDKEKQLLNDQLEKHKINHFNITKTFDLNLNKLTKLLKEAKNKQRTIKLTKDRADKIFVRSSLLIQQIGSRNISMETNKPSFITYLEMDIDSTNNSTLIQKIYEHSITYRKCV